MPLEVHPITEADFPDFVRISVAAFQDGMASKLSPKPAPPEYIEQEVKKHIKCQGEEPDTVFLKVIDTDLDGKMIACCKWRINEKERTEEQIKVQIPVPGKDKEGNQAAIDFMNHLAESRLKWMGTKPFYFLHLLVADPAHQRRGAGALLVKWGTQRADVAQLPSYLEGSREGRPLYARLGFNPVYERSFDLAKYGSEGIDTNTIMIRDPVPPQAIASES